MCRRQKIKLDIPYVDIWIAGGDHNELGGTINDQNAPTFFWKKDLKVHWSNVEQTHGKGNLDHIFVGGKSIKKKKEKKSRGPVSKLLKGKTWQESKFGSDHAALTTTFKYYTKNKKTTK